MDIPVNTQWIEIATDGGAPGATLGGFLALPPADHGPGLVLYQEIFGVNAHIRALAEQWALDGFVVLAPDVFWREQPRVELDYTAEDRARGIALAGALQPAQVMSDLRATVAALRGRIEVDGRRVGAIGYCLGGRLAWNAAATAGVDAAVCYYGGGIQNQRELAASISGPVQLHYAEHDDHIPPAAVESVRQALVGKIAEVHVYPGAHHGFNCWARASYHAPSAALAHGRSLAFLAAALN